MQEQQSPTLRPSDAVNLAGTETGRQHLSHTSIGTQLNCARKFQLHYVKRLEPIQTPRAFSLGRAFHEGIETRDPFGPAERMYLEGLKTPGMDTEKLEVERAIVEAGVAAALKKWPADVTEATELEYLVRVRSPYTGRPSQTFDLLGRADGVIDKGDHLELLEWKFVGRIDPATVIGLALDRQIALACYGLWRATGKPVRVVHYRYVKKPSIKQRQHESVAQFCNRLAEDYVERPDFYTHGETLFRSAEDLLETEQEIWEWCEQRRQMEQRGFFPKNTSSCGDFGGCSFRHLCGGDPDAASLYRVREVRA